MDRGIMLAVDHVLFGGGRLLMGSFPRSMQSRECDGY
jgi:hypothetical protein